MVRGIITTVLTDNLRCESKNRGAALQREINDRSQELRQVLQSLERYAV